MINKETKHISEILYNLFKECKIDKKLEQQKIIEQWSAIVGEKIGKISAAEKIIDDILYIRLNNSSWRTEILFQKDQILKQINTRVSNNIIKDIKFN